MRVTGRIVLLVVMASFTMPLARAQEPPPPALVARFAAAGETERAMLAGSYAEVETRAFIAALTAQGVTHGRRGDFVAAERFHQSALWLADRLDSAEQRAIAYVNLAGVYGQRGDFTGAQAFAERALAVAEQAGDEERVQAAAANLGIILRRLGDHDAALRSFGRASDLARKLRLVENEARVLNNIGLVHHDLGDIATARDYLTRSLDLKLTLDDRDPRIAQDIARSISNLGMLHEDIGDYAQALDHFQRARTLIERGGGGPTLTTVMANIGHVQKSLGQVAAARDQFTRALSIAEAQGDRPRIATLVYLLGVLSRDEARYAEAEALQRRSLTMREAMGEPIGLIESLGELSRLALEAGRPEEALAYAERSVAIAAEGRLLGRLWMAQLAAAEALATLRRDEAATAMYQASIATIEQLRQQTAGGDRARQLYLAQRLGPYYGLARLHARAGRAHEALLAVERARARTLLDVLAGRQSTRALGDDQRARERELTQAVASLSSQLDALLARRPSDQEPIAALEADLARARLAREAYTASLYESVPDLRLARGEAPAIGRDQLAALLTPSTAILSFVLDGDRSWVYVITGGPSGAAVTIRELAPSAGELVARANDFSRRVASRDLGFAAAAEALYDTLFVAPKLEPLLAGKSQLVIVPDGALWRVPFQALLTPRGTFVIEERAVSYAPSVSALAALDRRRKSRADREPFLLALGDPAFASTGAPAVPARLPQAAREVRALGKLYGAARSHVLTAEAATEAGLRSALDRASVVHLATHGVMDDVSPMYSHLLLAPSGTTDSGADGKLEAWELMNLGLDADLAVLSACETARGAIGDGEGVIGLSWSLFAAGASTAVVSQWEVDSASTTALMIAFHERLIVSSGAARDRTRAPEALRVAATRLMRTPAYRHPFYWAGFIVVGAS